MPSSAKRRRRHVRTRPANVICHNALEAAKASGQGNAADWTPRGLPPPTDARPGSPEKLEILARRLILGLELHHPDDTDGMEGMTPRTLARWLEGEGR